LKAELGARSMVTGWSARFAIGLGFERS